MRTVSATELTKSTRKILDNVVSRGETVVVERNRTVVAKIVPPERTMTARQALAGFTFPVLAPEEAAAWLEDGRGNFDETVRDPWA
jgi:antitoxin (DNA-binding transcriptional repressor) of toxin-antitoxin stability system